MDRRTALKAFAGSILLPTGLSATTPDIQRFGWRDEPESLTNFIDRHRHPFITQQNVAIKGTGKGKKAFLHLAMERVMGCRYVPHQQQCPDCVSQAAGLGVDILQGVQIALQGRPQRWVAKAATEPLYGGSRVEIGGYDGLGGGSTGHWMAEWLGRYGVLLRKKYLLRHDFSIYDPAKAVQMGRTGCPDALEPIAKLHPVKKTAICTSYEDLRDCIYNGSPVMVCSNVGFGNGRCVRDSQGFLRRRRSPWYHAMLFAGYDDEYERKGALCLNSWGADWISGPTRGSQPPGSFFIDSSTVTAMLRQGDSFAFSAFVGFPRLHIPPYVLH